MEALTRAAGVPAARAAGRRPALVFVGFMGAGKSTAARAVAAELGAQPLDTDAELERELGEPIEAFFERDGEPAFRAREEELVLRALEPPAAPAIALGGGALGSARVRSALREHTVVQLEVDPAEAWRRVAGGGRPLARDRQRFEQLARERAPVYAELADAVLPQADPDVARRALPALRALAGAPPGTRLLWATAASGDYPVLVGRGLLGSAFGFPPGRRYVVTDTAVERLYPIAGVERIAIPPGESHKTLAGAEAVLRRLAVAGAERGDLLVAVGGGVVGDLAGFCAAVYGRGMRWVGMPTTLVAQVDSAYGGKTGVDLPEGKNLVGAYHPPAAVLVDPLTLATLPAEELAAGYAEVVKTALVAGGELWARVARGDEVDDGIVLGCARTKLAVVAEDERDAGRRQVLNLGHTVGHAIEAATGYARLRHGEAVALGLLAALRLSDQEALRAEVAALLRARGLPPRFAGATPDEVLALLARDKKRAGGRVPFVLVDRPGAVTPGHDVDPSALRVAIEEVWAG